MKLAIQGHTKIGKEVIRILESLGGINRMNHKGLYDKYFYYISGDANTIAWTEVRPQHLNVFTLEEFEKEFPFKIGDEVLHKGHKAIVEMFVPREKCYYIRYSNPPIDGIYYTKWTTATELKMKEERNITLTLDKAKEWYKKGGELKEIALQAFSEKELTKVELPKTWKEYIQQNFHREGYVLTHLGDIAETTITGLRGGENLCPSKESAEAHLAMIQLEQLRNCYRGLFITVIGMPVWCIKRQYEKLIICQCRWGRDETFLSFQSLEVAEEYLKNFKPLIEKAGDLIS